MACFEGKCFERPKNEVRRSGSLQRKGSRVKVVPAGDLVMGVHPNAERPSEMENMNALNEGALEKRGYNSAQRDCGCAKDYNLPEPFVDKIFPKPPPPPVFTPEPPPKYEPKAPPPEEFVPIPEPELKDNSFPPPEPILPIPPNVKKQNPGPSEDGCTGYEWLSTQEQRERCCDELENVYGGVYEDQMKASELCRNPSFTTETKEEEPIPPLSHNTFGNNTNVGRNTPSNVPANVIKVNTKTNSNVRIVENNVGSGFTTDVVQTNGGPDSGFTVQTFQNGNITPVSDPNPTTDSSTVSDPDAQYDMELIDTGTSFSQDIPVGGNDSINHFTGLWTQPSFPPIATVPSNTSVPSLAQQGPAPEEAQVIGQNTVSNKPIVAPSSGMNLGLDEVHGMPQCNSIVRSVTVSRCGDENPYSRGMAIFDSYAGREAAPPGFVVDTNGRRVLKVKSSSGMRTRVVPAGLGGIPSTGATTSNSSSAQNQNQEQPKQDNTGSRGPTAGAVTASVFNSLTNVASDAFQYVNNQEANRVRLQIANLQQQRDLQLRAIDSGDLRTRAEAEARLAVINQQAQALQQGLERERLQMQSNQQIADRDMSFRTTALIAGSVLVLGMMGAGIYVATKK